MEEVIMMWDLYLRMQDRGGDDLLAGHMEGRRVEAGCTPDGRRVVGCMAAAAA